MRAAFSVPYACLLVAPARRHTDTHTHTQSSEPAYSSLIQYLRHRHAALLLCTYYDNDTVRKSEIVFNYVSYQQYSTPINNVHNNNMPITHAYSFTVL